MCKERLLATEPHVTPVLGWMKPSPVSMRKVSDKNSSCTAEPDGHALKAPG